MSAINLSDRVWQKIGGWESGEVFPLIPRPGIVCSNSYLIDTEWATIVIDPGTDFARFDFINQTLAARPGADDKALLVILTHCHHDHSHGSDKIRVPARAPNLFLVETSGAQALRDDNRVRTLTLIYPDAPSVCRRTADAELFGSASGEEQLLFAGAAGEIRLSAPWSPDASLNLCQTLTVGKNDRLHIYRSPGHTPCSVSIQAGELLFVGDLPFAADPGLIGLDGWNQTELLRSFDTVERLIDQKGIRFCLAGHGNPVPAEIMRKTLSRLQEEAGSLERVDVMDYDRIAVLKEFAGELLDEAEYLFTVISGRLYAVAHHLGTLEEMQEARRFSEALDLDKIERVLSGFRSFHEEFRAAQQPTLALIMKSVQTARAIERLFDAPKLAALLDRTLVRRASRLLSDYVSIVCGLRLGGSESTPDLGALLGRLVDDLDFSKLDGDEFMASADDADAYLTGLVRRLAFAPAFRAVQVRYVPVAEVIEVSMAPDRLGDMVVTLLESVVVSGATEIQMSCCADPASVFIRISGAVPIQSLSPRRSDLLQRTLAPLGARLHRENAGTPADCLVIELPRLVASRN